MEKTLKFRGNSPNLIKPLPTKVMVYNPDTPVKNVPYTVGERRARDVTAARLAEHQDTDELNQTEVIPPAAPNATIPQAVVATPPEVPLAKPISIGQQRIAELRAAKVPIAAPEVPLVKPITLGQQRIAEIQAAREAKRNERINAAGEDAGNFNAGVNAGANADVNADSNAASNAGVNAGFNAGANAASNAASNTASNAGANADVNAASNTGVNETNIDESNRAAIDQADAEHDQTFEETNESKKVPYNRSLPHLLRIGDDSTSEYIELRKQFAKSTGAFNAHYVGSFHELRKLYDISTAEQVEGMQYAFGVKQYGESAPIQTYLQKGCSFPHTQEVKRAIQRRIQTLQESMSLKGINGNTSLDKHKKEYLEKVLLDMESKFTRECRPDELVNGKPIAKPSAEPVVASSKGCPCLDDLSLLRDLTYILALLQGSVNPDVQEQINSIELGKILNVLRKNSSSNRTNAKSMLATAIQTLEGLAKQPVKGNVDQVQVILQTIYTHFEPSKPIPEPLTEDAVVTMLEEKIKTVQDAANHLTQMSTLQTELDTKTAEMERLQHELNEANQSGSGTQTQITELQERLARCESSLIATQGERNNARQNLVGLETTRQRVNELEAALEKAKGDKEKAIAGLRAAKEAAALEANTLRESIERGLEAQLNKVKSDKEKAITGLRAAKASAEAESERGAATMRASVEAAEAAVARAEALIATKETELAAALAEAETARQETEQVKSQRDAALSTKANAIQEKEQVTEWLEEVTQQLTGLESSANQTRNELMTAQAATEAANAQIAELQNELAEARASLASKTTTGDEAAAASELLRKQVEDLTGQLAAKEEERQQLEGRIRELLASTSQQIEEVRAEISALQGSLRDKEAMVVEKERELAECRETVQQLEAELAEANGKFADAEQRITDNEAQIKTLEEALRKCHIDSEVATAEKDAALAAKNAETATVLSAKNAEKDAALTVLGAEKDAALAAKNAEIAAALADNESEMSVVLGAKNIENAAALAAKNVEQQAKNAAAEVAKAALAKEIASLEEQLNLSKAAAETAKRNAETSLTTEKGEKESLMEQLAAAQARVAALENMLQQKNTNSASALEQAIQAAETKQSSALQTMMNEKDKEKAAALEAEQTDCSKRIGDLTERLRRLEQEKEDALRKKNDDLQAKQVELNTTRNAGAAATEAAGRAAQEAQEALTQKNQEIADTKTALAAAETKQAELDAKLKECEKQTNRITEQTAQLSAKDAILAAKEAELTLKQTALEAAEAASAEAKAEVASTKAQSDGKNVRINSLSRNLQTAEAALATAKAAATPEGAFQITQERLANLLSYLIVDDDARQQAQDYLSMKGDKIPDTVVKQKDMMCNFFKYLYDVVKMQMNDFRTLKLFPDAVKGKQTHLDIFQIFISSNLNGVHSPPFTKQQMLADLTNIFQYFFISSQGGDITHKAIPGSYTTLQKLYNVLITKEGGPLDSAVQSEKVILLLNKFGPLSEISLESSGNNRFYFVEKNMEAFRNQGTNAKLQAAPEGRFVPLILLAIKMVQLLYDEVTVTYRKMDSFCGYIKPSAEAVVPRNKSIAPAAPMNRVDIEKEAIEKARAVSLPNIAREINTYTGLVSDPPLGKDPLYHKTYLAALLCIAIENKRLTKLMIDNLAKIKIIDAKQFIRAKITACLQSKPSTFLNDVYGQEIANELKRFLRATF